jgi:hypothetical protein
MFPFCCRKLRSRQVAFSGETQSRSVNGYINVFRKPVDEAKHFGKRRSSLEAKVRNFSQEEAEGEKKVVAYPFLLLII